MPTVNQMNAAHRQGDNARAQVDAEQLNAADPPQLPTPCAQNSAASFSDAFGGEDDQAASAAGPPPAVDSRLGQRVNVSVSDWPIQRVMTDVHARVARVVAPNNPRGRQVAVRQRRRRCRRGQTSPTPAGASANDVNAANNDDDDYSVPSDVQDEISAAAQVETMQLWDNDAIDADITQVIRSRIAPMSRKTYND